MVASSDVLRRDIHESLESGFIPGRLWCALGVACQTQHAAEKDKSEEIERRSGRSWSARSRPARSPEDGREGARRQVAPPAAVSRPVKVASACPVSPASPRAGAREGGSSRSRSPCRLHRPLPVPVEPASASEPRGPRGARLKLRLAGGLSSATGREGDPDHRAGRECDRPVRQCGPAGEARSRARDAPVKSASARAREGSRATKSPVDFRPAIVVRSRTRARELRGEPHLGGGSRRTRLDAKIVGGAAARRPAGARAWRRTGKASRRAAIVGGVPAGTGARAARREAARPGDPGGGPRRTVRLKGQRVRSAERVCQALVTSFYH